MIKIEHLKKIFHTSTIETHAVSDASLHVKQGEFVAIMGSSGSGKSTLLSIMGLLDTPTSGSYILNGIDVSKASIGQADRFRREFIGFIFQNFNLLPNLTTLENVALALKYRNVDKSEIKDRAFSALQSVGMDARANHYPSQLSGGQQQRAAIARAITSNPQLILADEPTGNLDSKNGQVVMDILKEISNQGTTIVMVTHSEAQSKYGNRVLTMQDGFLAQ